MLDIKFEGQKQGEEVVALFHRSIWSYLKSLLLLILLLILPIVAQLLFSYAPLTNVCIVIAVFAFIIIIARTWFLWTNNIFLVTNIRVIALVQDAIFKRKFREAYLDDVCQVDAVVSGVSKSMFNYGDVLVQTEAEFWLTNIETPYDAKQTIFEALEVKKRQKNHPIHLIED